MTNGWFSPLRDERSPLALGLLLALVALLVTTSVATAQVMEIGDAGQVKVYDRPYVFDSNGAKAIDAPTQRHSPKGARPSSTMLSDAADAAALSPELIAAVAWRESGFRPGLVSRAGAVGEMQLMPGTARTLGVDPHDSAQNYRGGAAYLGALMHRYDGDLVRTLAAYNAGPGAVDRYGGLPPYKETRAYVAAILDRLSEQALGSSARAGR